MSKGFLRTAASIVSIGVAFLPMIGPWAKMAITVGLALVSSTLLGPKKPKQVTEPRDRLFATLDPTAPRKVVFGGPTAMPADVLYL